MYVLEYVYRVEYRQEHVIWSDQHHVISVIFCLFLSYCEAIHMHGFVGTLVQTEGSVLGQTNQMQPASKPNASPRPSILRKRDNEG